MQRRKGKNGIEDEVLFVVLAWMEAELEEFGFHGDAGDAEPAGGPGLVTVGELDGAGEDFAFGIFEHAAVDVRNFTAARCGQQFVDVIAECGCGRDSGGSGFVEDGLKVVDSDGVALGEEKSFADYVFEFADVARPGTGLEKVDGIGMN